MVAQKARDIKDKQRPKSEFDKIMIAQKARDLKVKEKPKSRFQKLLKAQQIVDLKNRDNLNKNGDKVEAKSEPKLKEMAEYTVTL